MTKKDKFVTFMGVPRADTSMRAGAAILGIPFECIGHRVRIGSDLAPAAIREQSCCYGRTSRHMRTSTPLSVSMSSTVGI